jgi:hypothetical protein
MSQREIDPQVTVRQVGANILAISGGRWLRTLVQGEHYVDVLLPVGQGYRVRISLRADDTYTVTREMKRGDKVFVKGVQTDVYCDELGEVAYYASCYRNVDFGDHKVSS